MKIRIFSKQKMKSIIEKIKEPTLIISIRCSTDSLKLEVAENFFIKKILFLQFDDVEENNGTHDCIPMSDEDALKIKEAVEEMKDVVTEIIVHCDAGISRSAGVAAAIGKYLNNDDMFVFGSSKYNPNITCYRKTLNAFMGCDKVDFEKVKFNNKIFSECLKLARSEEEWENLHFSSEEELDKWISDRLSTWGTKKIYG